MYRALAFYIIVFEWASRVHIVPRHHGLAASSFRSIFNCITCSMTQITKYTQTVHISQIAGTLGGGGYGNVARKP